MKKKRILRNLEKLSEKVEKKTFPNQYEFNVNRVTSYLKSGYKFSAVSTIVDCCFCEEEIGPVLYFSDGFWVWPGYLIHYLEKHTLVLPNEFLETMKRQKYRIDTDMVKDLFLDETIDLQFE